MRKTIQSNGASAARGYVVVRVPARPVEPTPATERVELLDPRRTPTLRLRRPPEGSGPRNPEQRELPPKGPRIHLPDDLPATEVQRVIIDPELIAQWEEEARRSGT